MTWWQTALVALASSAVGGILTTAGSDFLERRRSADRRREEAARAVGAALAALREIDPEVWGDRLAVRADALGIVVNKRDQWLTAAGGLDVLAAWHPNARVAELVETIVDRAGLVLIRLDEVAHGADVDEAWRVAIPRAYQQAVSAARELVRETREVNLVIRGG